MPGGRASDEGPDPRPQDEGRGGERELDNAAVRTTRALILARGAAEDAPQGAAALAPLVGELYSELRGLAASALRGARGGTLDTTALAHEAYVRLVDQRQVDFRDRARFLAAAAAAVRRALVDHLRKRGAEKRGGGRGRLTLHEDAAAVVGVDFDLLALEEALAGLAAEHPRSSSVVEMRFFSGMSEQEIALVLAVSDRTVRADLALGRAWLKRHLERGASAG